MRFYHFTAIIVTWYILEELTEKKICMHCALSISPKKIVNSAYISSSSVLFNFLSGHRFLNKAFAKTRHNRRVVNFSLFFLFLKITSVTLNITVYRLQTDCFVSFSSWSDVTLTFKFTFEQLKRNMFPFR